MIRVLNKLLKVTQSTESTSQTLIAKTLMAVVNPSIYLLYEDRCLYHKPAEIHGLLECVRTGGSSRVELPRLSHVCYNLSNSRDFKSLRSRYFYYLLPKNHFYSVFQYLLLSLPVLYDCNTNGKGLFSNLDS